MNNVKNYFWGLCKVVLKILLIGIAMTNFRLRAQNNYLDSRYDYYNMDTTGWVCIGRYDSGNPNWFIFDTIISGNNVFIDYKAVPSPPYHPVLRKVVEASYVKIGNRRLQKEIRKYIRKITFSTGVAEIDSAGFYVDIHLSYDDNKNLVNVSLRTCHNYTMYTALRDRQLLSDRIVYCTYCNNILCILNIDSDFPSVIQDRILSEPIGIIILHLFQKEIEICSASFRNYKKFVLKYF